MVSCMRYNRYLRHFISVAVFVGAFFARPRGMFANLFVKSSLVGYGLVNRTISGPRGAKSQSIIRSIDETCCGAASNSFQTIATGNAAVMSRVTECSLGTNAPDYAKTDMRRACCAGPFLHRQAPKLS